MENKRVLRLILDHLQLRRIDVAEHVSISDARGRTALHWGAWEEHGASALHILMKSGAEVDARDGMGRTALHLAAERGHATIVHLLMEAGADVHLRASSSSRYSPYTDQTPLEVAVLRNRTAVADFLHSHPYK